MSALRLREIDDGDYAGNDRGCVLSTRLQKPNIEQLAAWMVGFESNFIDRLYGLRWSRIEFLKKLSRNQFQNDILRWMELHIHRRRSSNLIPNSKVQRE